MTRSWEGERGPCKDRSAAGLPKRAGSLPTQLRAQGGCLLQQRVSWRSGLKIGLLVASPVTLLLIFVGEGGKVMLVMSRGPRSCKPQKYLKLEFPEHLTHTIQPAQSSFLQFFIAR